MNWLLYNRYIPLVFVLIGVLLSYTLIKILLSLLRTITTKKIYLQFDHFTDKEVIYRRNDNREWIAVTFYSKPQIIDKVILSQIWRLSPCTIEIRQHQSEIELFLTIFSEKETHKQKLAKTSLWFEKLSGDIKILKDKELREYYRKIRPITLKNNLTLLDDGRFVFGVINHSQDVNIDQLNPNLHVRSIYFFKNKIEPKIHENSQEIFRGSITQVGIRKVSKNPSFSNFTKFLSFINSLEFEDLKNINFAAMRFRIAPYDQGNYSIEEGIQKIEKTIKNRFFPPQGSSDTIISGKRILSEKRKH
ncbi:MAG: hypothetical protein ACFFCQ_17665 [Promethearchaeota archaeon]